MFLVKKRHQTDMRAHMAMASLVGIAAVVAGAVAIARSSTDTNISSVAKTQPFAATCPKIEWPYGCAWRPEANLGTKHSLVKKDKHRHFSMSGVMRGATAKRR
jgi:hypothetical protein